MVPTAGSRFVAGALVVAILAVGLPLAVAGDDGRATEETAPQFQVVGAETPGVLDSTEESEVTIAFEVANVGDRAGSAEGFLATEWTGEEDSFAIELDPGEQETVSTTLPAPGQPGAYGQGIQLDGELWVTTLLAREEPDPVAQFHLTAVDVPAVAAAGAVENVSVELENVGTAPGSVSLDYASPTTDEEIQLELDAGERDVLDVPVEIGVEAEHGHSFTVFNQLLDEVSSIVETTTLVDRPEVDEVAFEDVELPELHEVDETTAASVTVINTGDEPIRAPVEYRIDEFTIDQQWVELAPGAAERITSQIRPGEFPRVSTWEQGFFVDEHAVTDELLVVDEGIARYIDGLAAEIAALENNVSALEDTVVELEAALEDANATIDELENDSNGIPTTVVVVALAVLLLATLVTGYTLRRRWQPDAEDSQ